MTDTKETSWSSRQQQQCKNTEKFCDQQQNPKIKKKKLKNLLLWEYFYFSSFIRDNLSRWQQFKWKKDMVVMTNRIRNCFHGNKNHKNITHWKNNSSKKKKLKIRS